MSYEELSRDTASFQTHGRKGEENIPSFLHVEVFLGIREGIGVQFNEVLGQSCRYIPFTFPRGSIKLCFYSSILP